MQAKNAANTWAAFICFLLDSAYQPALVLGRRERRHHFAREAAQAHPTPFAAAGAAAVQQEIAGAGLAQRPDLPRDLIGRAVDRARQVDLDRITVRAIRSAEYSAVGRRRQLQLPQPVGEPS